MDLDKQVKAKMDTIEKTTKVEALKKLKEEVTKLRNKARTYTGKIKITQSLVIGADRYMTHAVLDLKGKIYDTSTFDELKTIIDDKINEIKDQKSFEQLFTKYAEIGPLFTSLDKKAIDAGKKKVAKALFKKIQNEAKVPAKELWEKFTKSKLALVKRRKASISPENTGKQDHDIEKVLKKINKFHLISTGDVDTFNKALAKAAAAAAKKE